MVTVHPERGAFGVGDQVGFVGDPVVEGVLGLAFVKRFPGGVVWVFVEGACGLPKLLSKFLAILPFSLRCVMPCLPTHSFFLVDVPRAALMSWPDRRMEDFGIEA